MMIDSRSGGRKRKAVAGDDGDEDNYNLKSCTRMEHETKNQLLNASDVSDLIIPVITGDYGNFCPATTDLPLSLSLSAGV